MSDASRFRAFRLNRAEGAAAPAGEFVELGLDDLSPGEVVIRVAYTSINYKDALAAAGLNQIVRT